jgi:trigger factor
MKVGESKTFPLQFPADYHGKDVAGKEADFLVTVKKIEVQHLPAVDEAFAKSLGMQGRHRRGLRADVKKNLEREVKFRVLARNKAAVMDALVKAELDLPKAAGRSPNRAPGRRRPRRPEAARHQGRRQGADPGRDVPPQAERRVRLGLVVAELVRANNLQAKPEQLQAHIEELARATRSPPRWCAGTSATASAWPRSKPW